jgi:hypothetical protein
MMLSRAALQYPGGTSDGSWQVALSLHPSGDERR